MKYYQDITLLPDGDIALGFIWQKIFQQVHIALVEQKVDEQHSVIAVSFPAYNSEDFPLGNKLRVLAMERKELEKLNLSKFLSRFDDYCHLKSIKVVPSDRTVPVAYVRKKVKGSTRIEKDMLSKAKHWSEKSGKSLDDCLKELEKSKPQANSRLPFVWMESLQTKSMNPTGSSRFPIFIERREFETHKAGLFNCYGLSFSSNGNVATVPHF